MSNAFAPIVRARPNPIFGRPVHQGSPPIDYSPILLLKPFGFRIAPDTLSSDENLIGQRGITPAFGYSAPHPSAGGTLTLLIHALPSAHYGPLRHPSAPDLSLTGVRLIIPDHASGLPVLRALSLCTCCRHYPGAAAGRTPRSSHPAVSAFPGRVAGSACTSSCEACSAFTRVAACTLARSPIRDPLSQGFRHFVSSMPAPVASGGSESPGGTCTHWKAPPCHGAHPKPTFPLFNPAGAQSPVGADQSVFAPS